MTRDTTEFGWIAKHILGDDPQLMVGRGVSNIGLTVSGINMAYLDEN